MERTIRTLVRWGTYPLLLALTLGVGAAAIARGWDLKRTYGITVLSLVVVLGVLEALLPARPDWRMTWRSFRRDLKYISAGGLVAGGVNAAFGWLALVLAPKPGHALSGAPLLVQAAAALLVFEALNYLQHRASHELGGRVGRFLWRSHVAHHLPDRFYVLMHAAFHPLNALIVRALVTLLPLQLMGISAEATLVFNLVVNFSGIVSHCNLDLRAGWLNYLLVGPELHRFHHSANVREARNYAQALPIFDLLFGSFVYRPGAFPAQVGVEPAGAYPESSAFWQVMLLPFRAPAPVETHAAKRAA